MHISKFFLYSALVAVVACGGAALTGNLPFIPPLLILFFIFLSIAFQGYPTLKGFSYTMVILTCFAAAVSYPQYFTRWGNFDLSTLITPSIQLIMFGMGTTMSLRDFAGLLKMPTPVLIGVTCQFAIMPVLGYTIAQLSGLPNEIAAGIVLIGCVPSGMASNVIAYLARANVALSVTITSIATMLGPLFTPLLMKTLAGEFIEINTLKMMWDILKMVILPVGIGLLFNQLFHGKTPWLAAVMPYVSMFGIAFSIVVIAAAGRDNLLTVGPLLVMLVLTHNVLGYTVGYWTARLFRLKERDCRTIAIEVGMQNGGLASGLSKEMGRIATLGLAAAIFGPLMNVTGSILASWWHRKTPKD